MGETAAIKGEMNISEIPIEASIRGEKRAAGEKFWGLGVRE